MESQRGLRKGQYEQSPDSFESSISLSLLHFDPKKELSVGKSSIKNSIIAATIYNNTALYAATIYNNFEE